MFETINPGFQCYFLENYNLACELKHGPVLQDLMKWVLDWMRKMQSLIFVVYKWNG